MPNNITYQKTGQFVKEEFTIDSQILVICSYVFFTIICQFFNIFGIVTNVINIICFVMHGFQDSINISLLGLSISDLGGLVTMVWACICFTPAFATADLSFEVMEVAYVTASMPHFTFTRISSCITAMITLERCLSISAPLQIKDIITPTRVAVVTVSLFIILNISAAPVFFVNKLGRKFSPLRNTTIFGLLQTEGRENIEKISFAINNVAIPFCAFIIIVNCTVILSIKLRETTKWRMNAISTAQGEKVTGRNLKVAKMVVMVSTLFIVCFIPMSITMLAVVFIPELSINGKYMPISIIIGGLSYIMESINTSMNIFIYYHMSSKYKTALASLFA